MDFSTNHYSIVYYCVWFIAACIFRKDFVLADGVLFLSIVWSVVNIVVFSSMHARNQNKSGFESAGLCGCMLSFSLYAMYKFDSMPIATMPVVCFTVGEYFAFDSDFYYGEDLPMKYTYGLFLLFCAKSGVPLFWGAICSSVVVLLGWVNGQRKYDINMTLKEALLAASDYDKESLYFGAMLALFDSIPLYFMGGYGLLYTSRANSPAEFPKFNYPVFDCVYIGCMVVIFLVLVKLSHRLEVEDRDSKKCKQLQDQIGAELQKLLDTSFAVPDVSVKDWILETSRESLHMMFGNSNCLIQRLEEGKELAKDSEKAISILDRCISLARELDAVPNKVE